MCTGGPGTRPTCVNSTGSPWWPETRRGKATQASHWTPASLQVRLMLPSHAIYVGVYAFCILYIVPLLWRLQNEVATNDADGISIILSFDVRVNDVLGHI